MKVYIYVLTEPDGETVRYVGKSNEYRLKGRLKEHCRPSMRKFHTHKNMWIRSLLAKGQRPILKVIEECTEETYRDREHYWVDHYKNLGVDLTNGTKGGEGACRIHNRVITEEQKKRISETLKTNYKTDPKYKVLASEAGKKTRGIKRKFKFKQHSSHVGISLLSPGRWRAYCHETGKHVHLGVFKTEQDAITAREQYLQN